MRPGGSKEQVLSSCEGQWESSGCRQPCSPWWVGSGWRMSREKGFQETVYMQTKQNLPNRVRRAWRTGRYDWLQGKWYLQG